MEDDTGLELSLGLSFGGSSFKMKNKIDTTSDTRTLEGDKVNKPGDNFKTFLHYSGQKQDSASGTHGSDLVKHKPHESFFSDLSKAPTDPGGSLNLNGRGDQVASSNKYTENEDNKRLEVGNKRRIYFSEINHQNKREREGSHSDIHERTRTSHISIATEESPTAENEDVAESEVEESTSRLVSHQEDGSKLFIGAGGSPEVQKKVHGMTDSVVLDFKGENRFNSSSENEIKMGNLICGIPYSIQSVNSMSTPYSLHAKESVSVVPSGSSAHHVAGMMQVMPAANSDQPGVQPATRGNMPIIFGYSPVQLPMLDKDNLWGSISHPQQLQPNFATRGPPNSAAMQVTSHNPSEAKADDKSHATGEGSSFQTETVKENTGNFRPAAEGFSLDFSAIKPGISAEIKFGGSGSYPDLPWVSTKGSGPNGKTISGVTYRYSANQIRIVCACHGSHMSPEEFVQHASDDNVTPDNGSGAARPSGNAAASSQS